jgi:hypothetical protein
MNLPDDPELRRVEAMLRAIDPGRGAAQQLSNRGRRRVLWSWRHPLLAWCIRHHAAIAVSVAAAVVALLFLWMVREQRAIRERQEVPKPVSAPVRVLGG